MLNHKIVARLRFLGPMRSRSILLDFRIGEGVKFRPEAMPEVTGILTQYNKKTVPVITDSVENCRVSPSLLSRAEPETAESSRRGARQVVPPRIAWAANRNCQTEIRRVAPMAT